MLTPALPPRSLHGLRARLIGRRGAPSHSTALVCSWRVILGGGRKAPQAQHALHRSAPHIGQPPSPAARTMPRGLDKADHRACIIAENHGFDNYVGCFPGADGTA